MVLVIPIEVLASGPAPDVELELLKIIRLAVVVITLLTLIITVSKLAIALILRKPARRTTSIIIVTTIFGWLLYTTMGFMVDGRMAELNVPDRIMSEDLARTVTSYEDCVALIKKIGEGSYDDEKCSFSASSAIGGIYVGPRTMLWEMNCAHFSTGHASFTFHKGFAENLCPRKF